MDLMGTQVEYFLAGVLGAFGLQAGDLLHIGMTLDLLCVHHQRQLHNTKFVA